MSYKATPKTTKELLKVLSGIEGVRVEQSKRNSHHKVFCPNGKMVSIAHTSSDKNATWSAVRYLRRNGVDI
jgi:hypothetical protein